MLSISDSGSTPPCPAPFNLAAYVLAHADTLPKKTALRVSSATGQQEISYRALKQAVLGTGGGLLQAGCVPGDIVLMRLGNTLDFPIAYLGALAVGLVPVPTSAVLTAAEVARIVDDLRPRLILHDPDVPSATGAPVMGLATLRALRDHAPADWHMGDPDRLGYIVYTSGTSGHPRAVAHAHRAIWARRMMHDGWYGLRCDDVMLHAGAFNWTFTLGTGLMDPWSVGATAVIPARGATPADLGPLLAQTRATLFAGAPGVYRQMLAAGPLPALPSLRHGLSAGEKLPEATRTAWTAQTGTEIYEAYGLSECSTFISGAPTAPAAAGTIGAAQPGRAVAILGPQGPVARDTPGDIAIRADDPGLMRGYLNQPEETAARHRGAWFCTGDIGQMDAAGQITYLGRADDMMNAGGFRVSPLEVETALADAPGVTGIAVTQVQPKPDVWIIAAFYTGPKALDADGLAAYVAPKLARYKHPRAYVHIPKLPVGANGKLIRRRLALYWAQNRTPTEDA